MKPGDLVKWIGFPEASNDPPVSYGIVIKVNSLKKGVDWSDDRIDVLWGGGRVGKSLYPLTLEVISESR